MENLNTIPPAVAVLIPTAQRQFTKEHFLAFSETIKQLETLLEKCPKIGETDGLKEHPAIFHYFTGYTDFYICEYDRNDLMFGYSILNGDLENSEWGYISLSELTAITSLNLNYLLIEKSIEAALYTAYPDYFKKPLSLTV